MIISAQKPVRIKSDQNRINNMLKSSDKNATPVTGKRTVTPIAKRKAIVILRDAGYSVLETCIALDLGKTIVQKYRAYEMGDF